MHRTDRDIRMAQSEWQVANCCYFERSIFDRHMGSTSSLTVAAEDVHIECVSSQCIAIDTAFQITGKRLSFAPVDFARKLTQAFPLNQSRAAVCQHCARYVSGLGEVGGAVIAHHRWSHIPDRKRVSRNDRDSLANQFGIIRDFHKCRVSQLESH